MGIEKWQGKGDRAVTPGKNGQAMDEALANLSSETDAEMGAGRSAPQPPLKKAEEFVDQLCVCALYDLPFIARYQKQPNGSLRPTESIKVLEGQRSGTASAPQSVAFPADLIEGPNTPCAWCGAQGSHYHCHCGGVVCGARVVGQLFKCRASCGAEWTVGEPVKEIKTTTSPPDPKAWEAPKPQASAWKAPVKPVNANRLLAGPSSQPIAKRNP